MQGQICAKELVAVRGAMIAGSARRDGNQIVRPRHREYRLRWNVIARCRQCVAAVSADFTEIFGHCWLTPPFTSAGLSATEGSEARWEVERLVKHRQAKTPQKLWCVYPPVHSARLPALVPQRLQNSCPVPVVRS